MLFGSRRVIHRIVGQTDKNCLSSVSSLLIMGSVGDHYKCPLCGRVGNGGYVIDGINVGPICTADQAVKSCLDRITDEELEPIQILATALQKIAGTESSRRYSFLAWDVVPFIRDCRVAWKSPWSDLC